MNSSKQKIYLYISDIASYIGQNKWDYLTPFERLWKRCDKTNYKSVLQETSETINVLKGNIVSIEVENLKLKDDLDNKRLTQRQYTLQLNKNNNVQNELRTKINNLQDSIDNIDLSQQQKLEKTLGKEIIEQIHSAELETNVKRDMFKQALSELDISDEKISEMKEHGESYINKTHGTLKEDDAIQMFESKFKVKLDTSQQFNSMCLVHHSSTSKYNWYICGKVDGLYRSSNNNESYIVEVKNRTKSFFNTLRDYEKTQIHLYMYMLDIAKSKLVEKYNNKIRVTEIFENKDYTFEIIECLELFLTNFEKQFLENEKAKREYLLKSKDQKQKYIFKTFLLPIQKHLESKIKIDNLIDNDDDCMIDDLD